MLRQRRHKFPALSHFLCTLIGLILSQQFNSIYFPKRNQAQEGCSERPIGHLMSADQLVFRCNHPALGCVWENKLSRSEVVKRIAHTVAKRSQ